MNLRLFAARSEDTKEVSFRKFLILLISLSCCGCAVVWTGLYYFIFGIGVITFLPLLFFILVSSAIVISHILKNHYILVYTQLICITWISAFLQWMIGGLDQSGFVTAWSFLGPIGAVIFLSKRMAVLWMMMFLAIIVISAIWNPSLIEPKPLVSNSVRTVFYIMNIGTAASVVFVTSLWFGGTIQNEKKRAEGLFISQKMAYKKLEEAQAQLIQSEKMASLGQLTAGVAHEINNPINFVSANIKPLRRNFNELVDSIVNNREIDEKDLNENIEETNQLLAGIEEGANRTIEIVKGLRNFARHEEHAKKKVNLNEGIESTLLLLNYQLSENKIEVEKSLGNLPEVECFSGEINQVFNNILNNSIEAIGNNGKIFISTSHENKIVKISFKDTGKGMSGETIKKVFDPFFTTKDVGKGTGLGLSVSFGIIEKHNGRIEVSSEVGKGSEFVVWLPV